MIVIDLWDGEALRIVRRIDDPMLDVALQLMTHPQTGLIKARNSCVLCLLLVDDLQSAKIRACMECGRPYFSLSR